MEFGPLPPTQDAANDDLPALPEYSEEGKLEILVTVYFINNYSIPD